MESISKSLTDKYLDRFEVIEVPTGPTLFGPDWDMLKLGRCPHCTNKLKLARSKPIAFCNSKKHNGFAVLKSKLNTCV